MFVLGLMKFRDSTGYSPYLCYINLRLNQPMNSKVNGGKQQTLGYILKKRAEASTIALYMRYT